MKKYTDDNGIAIFVSHRIDLKSKRIDNPMYHDMRCGAVYDENKNSDIPGDDTGDNISKLRIPFCELTVQYWAWKNYDAEYYGLCHYRRYMSFCDQVLDGNDYLLHIEKELNSASASKLQLFNYSEMEKQIRSHDIIVGKSFDTTKITRIPPKKSVLDLWLASTNLVDSDAIYLTIDIVREMFPDYAQTMNEYLASRLYRGYNCYVMKKELFQKLCEFEYAVLFEFYKRYDMTGFEGNKQRTPGYMGELLFGVFICHMEKLGYDVKENQIAFFDNTKSDSQKNDIVTYNKAEESSLQVVIPHEPDKNTNVISNPAYVNVCCGAFNNIRKNTNCPQNDNTGDNISSLYSSLGALTSQYWAWKNIEAEHYGIVKYKAYFALNGKGSGIIRKNALDGEMVRKFCLNSGKKAEKLLCGADIVYPCTESAEAYGDELNDNKAHTAADAFKTHLRIGGSDILDEVTAMISELAPEYGDSMDKFLDSDRVYNTNGFIMSKELFNKYNEFAFKVLFEYIERYDIEHKYGRQKETVNFVADLLFGIFVTWALDNGHSAKTVPMVRFSVDKIKGSNLKAASESGFKAEARRLLKKIAYSVSPAYRVALRNEKYLLEIMDSMASSGSRGGAVGSNLASSAKKTPWDNKTLTSNIDLTIACLAQEIHETHKASFGEFKDCHTDKSVVILCTGPTMQYYSQIPNIAHIGVNSAFKRDDIKLDYYFTTDYESRNPWFDDLKNYDFVKFFGQYSAGIFRERFQVSEKLIRENNARRFFQGAPSEDIHLNIEFYPLMGFYTIAFQAIHFALYTNAKRIYLVGCDCSMSGYFDGSDQLMQANTLKWVNGYTKLREHVERFYPDTEIISINPDGLRGMFHDVYTKSFLEVHPEINPNEVEILDPDTIAEQG